MGIVLYSNNCPRCKILKQKLKENNIEYEEENSVDKMMELGITQVPVLSVNGELLTFGQANEWVNKQREVSHEYSN